MGIYGHFGVHQPFDPAKEYVTSPIRFLTPGVLAALRLSILLLSIGIWVYILRRLEHGPNSGLQFVTLLPLIFFPAYFFAAFANGLDLILQSRAFWIEDYESVEESDTDEYTSSEYITQTSNRPSQALYAFLTTAVRTFPLYVGTAFWNFFASPRELSAVPDLSYHMKVHFLTIVISLFETLCTNTPEILWPHLLPSVGFLACYLGVIYSSVQMNYGECYYSIIVHCFLFAVVFSLVRCIVSVRIRIFGLDKNMACRGVVQ